MPLVLCTVMALLYLALFNMQEYMMMYESQRVAAVAAREEAYLDMKPLIWAQTMRLTLTGGKECLLLIMFRSIIRLIPEKPQICTER